MRPRSNPQDIGVSRGLGYDQIKELCTLKVGHKLTLKQVQEKVVREVHQGKQRPI
jgi:hypothetical protein